jgi:hypothetical protein
VSMLGLWTATSFLTHRADRLSQLPKLKRSDGRHSEKNQETGTAKGKGAAVIMPNDVRFPASAFSGGGSIFSFQGVLLHHRDPPQPNCIPPGL